MKILIYGASGATGKILVRQALLLGHEVTAFVRSPEKVKISNSHLHVIRGDVVNYSQVTESLKGQDAVFSALGADSIFRFDQNVIEGMRNILDAMKAAHVTRFIYMSSAGVSESRKRAGMIIKNVLPRFLPHEIAGHEVREDMIRQTDLDWTIVRPVTLTNGQYTDRFRSGETIFTSNFTATISRADVAFFMLQQLQENTFVRKIPLVMY